MDSSSSAFGGDLKTTSQTTPTICESINFCNLITSKFDKPDDRDKPEKHQTHTTTNITTPAAPKESTNLGKGGKLSGGDKKVVVILEEKIKVESDFEYKELLGSVTILNCPGTRTSARVIQKMKQDQIRPTTPPPPEREHKKDEKNAQKTPSQLRANKPTWTNLERNHFFDALHEFGKDFESIGNYINAKLKRKSPTDICFKTKDQVRQHYYQTYHKICKYIKFSDEIKKLAQELYALINYGEMRRKLQFVTDKHFMKLKHLVYQGHITVRCKGKNIRIKTPSCKSLRRLNQLDDSLEDIRLPSKIEVIVSPANMESLGRVQTLAQNPRAKTTVPLHKKLVNFIKAFQYKWRSAEMKLAEEEAKLFPAQTTSIDTQLNGHINESHEKLTPIYQDPEMCFLPKPGVTIHRPLLSITEYLSSVNICLTAYEERMGVKVRGETLSHERYTNKRQRTESGSDKRSPEAKKPKHLSSGSSPAHEKPSEVTNEAITTIKEEPDAVLLLKAESSGDELSDEINVLLSETDLQHIKEEPLSSAITLPFVVDTNKTELNTSTPTSSSNSSTPTTSTVSGNPTSAQQARAKRGGGGGPNNRTARASLTFKPLISDDVIRRIRKGWTVTNAADITIGDLYVVLGQDSKLELEYFWTAAALTVASELAGVTSTDPAPCSVFMQKQNGMPYNPSECDDPQLLRALTSATVGNKLKHLLLIANLSERIRKRQCSCGHTCERNAVKTRIERDLAAKTFVSNKTFSSSGPSEGNALFRQPILPLRRPIFSMDPVKQLNTLSRQKMSRQVLVQRLLLPGGANHSYDLLDVKNLQNNFADFKRNEQSLPYQSLQSQTNHSKTVSSQVTSTSSTAASSNVCNFATAVDASSSIYSLPHSTPTTTQSYCAIQDDCAVEAANVTVHNELSMPSSFQDSAYDDCSNTSTFNGMSPMHLLRDSTSNSRWLEENLNDFSLTSLLGHLDEINASRDILDPSSNLSVISESSVDYMHKFQEITALMQSQDKD